MAGYRLSAPVNCEKALDMSGLRGKTAVVTGGMSMFVGYGKMGV